MSSAAADQAEFAFQGESPPVEGAIHWALREFREFGEATRIFSLGAGRGRTIPVYVNEFWTSKQRAAHSLHEVSYRACFKPQLPRFFIERLTGAGDVVYDPFMGRGTTPLEAGLMGRVPAGCDINPLSTCLVEPRFSPPDQGEVVARLEEFDLESETGPLPEELLAFYHPETLREITRLRAHLIAGRDAGTLDPVDRWIRMVATNRLTGHSPGFFSVYTLPPNQAVSVQSQLRINEKRKQTPPRRDVRQIVAKKSRSLLSKLEEAERKTLAGIADRARFLTASCDATPQLESDSVALIVTSPPFLAVVDYEADNWLRCWFNGIDPSTVGIWQLSKAEAWQARMTEAFREFHRVVRPGGHIAFEVGEVQGGKLRLEELVVPAGLEAGLTPVLVLINDQVFTKTSNCWGIDNLQKGTNTNRIVLFRKDA